MPTIVVHCELDDPQVEEHCGQCQVFTFRLDGDLNSQFDILDKRMRVTCPKCKQTFYVKRGQWWECSPAVRCHDLNHFPAFSGVPANALVAVLPDLTSELLYMKAEHLAALAEEMKAKRQKILEYLSEHWKSSMGVAPDQGQGSPEE